MTESQIRSNITYNQNILDELYMEKSKIESQLYELDLLRDKVSGLQQRFGDRQQHRQTMLQRITHSTIQNKILKTYYAVEGKFDGNTNININAVIEDQKVKLGDVSVESDGILKVGVSHSADGENSISVGSENANVKFNIDNSMLEGSGSVVVGNNTYTVTVTVSAESLQLEKSVSTQLEGGSVTSKVGIIKSNNENWKPVPVPVPIEVPYPGVIPEFDIDWETVGEVAVIGAVVYAGIYIGVAIYTGGGSIFVLPPPIPV